MDRCETQIIRLIWYNNYIYLNCSYGNWCIVDTLKKYEDEKKSVVG